LSVLLLVLAIGFVQYRRGVSIREARLRPQIERIVRDPVPRHPEKAPFYTVEDLGTIGRYNGSLDTAINALGQVVGNLSYTAPMTRTSPTGEPDSPSLPFRAFLWSDGRMQELGALGDGDSWVHDINASGQVVGSADNHPFLWAGGVLTDLAPGEGNAGSAAAINEAGQIVGALSRGRGPSRAFLWTNGTIRDLGTLAGEESGATDVNASGQVVGRSSVDPLTSSSRAFLWIDGQMRNLGTLGGSWSVATAINDAGVVVGSSRTPDDKETHACRWAQEVLWDLGTLRGDGESRANDINASGQIVGYTDLGPPAASAPPDDSGPRAFLYTDATGMVDLNTRIDRNVGWELHIATAINNAGQIVGAGSHRGKSRPFRLTPIIQGKSDRPAPAR
jgi:probable HAF family extracellular repeat protein